MKDEDRLALLYRVASMRYEEGFKKNQIAKQIDQSATQVSNLLREAQRKGILRIRVDVPKIPVLQDRLKRYFGLRDAIVIPTDRDCALLLANLAKAAADYFEHKVSAAASVALAGGYLMYEMVSRLPERNRDIDIYPAAIVGSGPSVTHIDPVTLVTLLWAKSGHGRGRAHYITLTPPEGVSKFRQYYSRVSKTRQLRPLLKSMKDADLVFASLGGFEATEAYLAVARYSTRNLFEAMTPNADNPLALSTPSVYGSDFSRGSAVGDFAYSFFDAGGRTKPEWNLATSIGIARLKQLASMSNKTVAVVVGGYKQKSLNAVLRGKMCNALITDAEAAEEALRVI